MIQKSLYERLGNIFDGLTRVWAFLIFGVLVGLLLFFVVRVVKTAKPAQGQAWVAKR